MQAINRLWIPSWLAQNAQFILCSQKEGKQCSTETESLNSGTRSRNNSVKFMYFVQNADTILSHGIRIWWKETSELCASIYSSRQKASQINQSLAINSVWLSLFTFLEVCCCRRHHRLDPTAHLCLSRPQKSPLVVITREITTQHWFKLGNFLKLSIPTRHLFQIIHHWILIYIIIKISFKLFNKQSIANENLSVINYPENRL